jgi:hypothetical protein
MWESKPTLVAKVDHAARARCGYGFQNMRDQRLERFVAAVDCVQGDNAQINTIQILLVHQVTVQRYEYIKRRDYESK